MASCRSTAEALLASGLLADVVTFNATLLGSTGEFPGAPDVTRGHQIAPVLVDLHVVDVHLSNIWCFEVDWRFKTLR